MMRGRRFGNVCSRQAYWVAVAAALLAVGCSKSHAAEVEPGTLNVARCRYLERCHPGALLAYPGGEVSGCVAAASEGEPQVVDASACVRLLEADACSLELTASKGLAFFLGREPWALFFPLGSPCRDQPFTPDDAREPAREGQACLSPSERGCEPDTYCAANLTLQQVGNQFCGTCVALRALGESCGPAQRCLRARCVAGTCQALAEAGAPCTSSVDCDRGSCERGQCTPFNVPVPSDGASEGATCSEQPSLQGTGVAESCDQDPSLACVSGRCVVRPDLGGGCDSFMDCRVGQICADGRCVTRRLGIPVGAACRQGERCADGMDCDIASLTCRPPAELGESCTSFCARGLQCGKAGVCEELREDGVACTDDGECKSGLCQRDLLPWCTRSESGGVGCSIPSCEDCGVCSQPQGVALCR